MGWRKRELGNYCLVGMEFQFGKMKKFWKGMVVMVAHLKMVKMVNFVMYTLPQFKKHTKLPLNTS